MHHKAYTRLLFFLFAALFIIHGCQLFRVTEVDKEKEIEKEEADPAVGYVDYKVPREITPAGVEYAVLEPGNGMELSSELRVKLHYTGYIGDDLEVFDSSYEREEPISFIIGRGMVIPAWDEAMEFLRVGDKARLWVPHEMAYGIEGRGPIPPRTNLVFDLEILDAETVEKPSMWPVEEKDTLVTESGLQVIMIEEGKGEQPIRGNVLVVHYSGYLSDGTLFDSSVQREVPLRFVLGTSQVIQGFDEGFYLLNQGAKARFIIPPDLAYGERGTGPIPPGETLFFDVELIEIQY